MSFSSIYICQNPLFISVRDFTIRSNSNGLGLGSNAIKDLCSLILHQLVVGWSVRHTVRQVVSEPDHRFELLEPHCEGGIVRDFTIHSNTNGLGLRSNAIKDLYPLILHQLVIGWIGKAHGTTISNLENLVASWSLSSKSFLLGLRYLIHCNALFKGL